LRELERIFTDIPDYGENCEDWRQRNADMWRFKNALKCFF